VSTAAGSTVEMQGGWPLTKPEGGVERLEVLDGVVTMTFSARPEFAHPYFPCCTLDTGLPGFKYLRIKRHTGAHHGTAT